jgi:hypothetical protein
MDSRSSALASNDVRLGSLTASDPDAVIERATAVAKRLADVIEKQKLYKTIKERKFVFVDGWTTLGAMLGVVPREVSVVDHQDLAEFEATVELIRVSDGAVIGRASSVCGVDEDHWSDAERYARRSMAITRATGKAFRLSFSWVMTLAGYAATPAEEMDGVDTERNSHDSDGTRPRRSAPMSANQKNKLFELYIEKFGGSDEEALEGLNSVWQNAFKHGFPDATLAEASKVISQMIAMKTNKHDQDRNGLREQPASTPQPAHVATTPSVAQPTTLTSATPNSPAKIIEAVNATPEIAHFYDNGTPQGTLKNIFIGVQNYMGREWKGWPSDKDTEAWKDCANAALQYARETKSLPPQPTR